jgi:CRISPR-associated endonuclease/helicase Cas3
MQTGEQPDDPFFDLGDIVVTTYDQFLSSMLCASYGLSRRQANTNCAIATGNLVVFDEFHLMQPDEAFLTAVEGMRLFGAVSRSVWMTATATEPLMETLRERLEPKFVELSNKELEAISVGRGIRKALRRVDEPLTAGHVLHHAKKRVLVVVNTVKRAQALYGELQGKIGNLVLLHSRFFQEDRKAKQDLISQWLGKTPTDKGVVIATQVVEAGLDLSAEAVLTDLCPMNALMQRAGRCARFAHQSGTVYVHAVQDSLPYSKTELQNTWEHLWETDDLRYETAAEWVDLVHKAADRKLLDTDANRQQKLLETIRTRLTGENFGGVADLIRGGTDSIRVIIADSPGGWRPSEFESLSVLRRSVRGMRGLVFDPDAPGCWREPAIAGDFSRDYVVAVGRSDARYTREVGLELGVQGALESPRRVPPAARSYRPIREESWAAHCAEVRRVIAGRIAEDFDEEGLVLSALAGLREVADMAAIVHDVGKLQARWQDWATAYQQNRDPEWKGVSPLAHTDYDPNSEVDRVRSRRVTPKRPPHAAASAYYGAAYLGDLDRHEQTAVVHAVVAHHGGWWRQHVEVGKMIANWGGELSRAGLKLDGSHSGTIRSFARRYFQIELVVADTWPLTATVLRLLRLSDQRAVEEANADD